MKVRGERIIIFGDSLSHPGADSAPVIQEITLGSNRSSSAPGDLLGSYLLEQGAEAVRVNAKVGRSALSFISTEPAAQLIATDQAFKPTKVVVMLGTNDAERDLAKTEAAMTQIRDAYKSMGAEIWAIGPMTYVGNGAALNDSASRVFTTMQRVFDKAQTVDARPLSIGAARAGDGIHFTPAGAAQLAPKLAQTLLTSSSTVGRNIAIGFVGVFTLGLLAWFVMNRRKDSAVGLKFHRQAKQFGLGARPNVDEIAAQLRDSIERQVKTTASGKKLVACDAAAVSNLVSNVVGNLAIGVDGMIDDSLEG